MREIIEQLFREQNVFAHINEGIQIANVSGTPDGFNLAKEIVLRISNNKTALFLSGGRTPKDFYHILSTEEQLEIGTLGLVDERFGPRFHTNSNEKMIMDSGLLQSMDKKSVKFHPILTGSEDMQKTAEEYDEILRSIHATYQQSIGILGIGVDGHTAGLPARMANGKWQMANGYDEYRYVIAYDYPVGIYGKRITQTFLGLSMLDMLIVMVFGEDKKEALEKMFADGPEEEVPSRFYKRPDIAVKTFVITDQKI